MTIPRVPLHALGMAGFLALVASVPVLVALLGWAKERAIEAAWRIEGPPCPVTAAPPGLVAGDRPLKVFAFGAARFARRYGHVDCMPFPDGRPFGREFRRVCQFTAPETVVVMLGERTWAFRPGVGQPATVTVRRGEVSCVLAGWFAG